VPSVVTATSGSLLLERSWQDALMGHWTFDDGAGAVLRDKAVFVQNNAALSGANYKWVSGKVGGGLSLTATDLATVTDNDALEASLGGTYMFWVKPNFTTMGSAGTAFFLSKGVTTGSGWYFRKVSGQQKVTFNMGAASATTDSLIDGAWTHIAAVVKSSGSRQIELYVNGVLVSASSASATAVVNATNLLFGCTSGGNDNFTGVLDDVRIYKNEVSLADLQAIHARGFAAKSGHYSLRADNNNRLVALLNGDGLSQTRVQPAFQIGNWYGTKTPNGTGPKRPSTYS
jgi:hypothetical protein